MKTTETQNEQILLTKLSKDLKAMASTMTRLDARMLVGLYYDMQEERINTAGKARACTAAQQSHSVVGFFEDQARFLENQIATALKYYAESQPMGQWALNVTGIGPIIAAALIAHIDIEQAPTVGHIWRFAGLDPTRPWEGSEKAKVIVNEIVTSKQITTEHYAAIAQRTNTKLELFEKGLANFMDISGCKKVTKDLLIKYVARRPWNAALKTLCWKIGESFVKVMNNESAVYGKLYITRKAYEHEKNDKFEYSEQASKVLVSRPTHAQKDTYKAGKLPDGHLHARAKRYAVKLFLADWHAEAYRQHFKKEPPLPYPIAILGHAHMRAA